ncbi:hypothetical protein ACIPSE_44205 [Streptomyces sp. NPDC090106]|uniref:hypothetical protein n=1 Tax=Streptomyces sp. NPDC090106 TaxID=3365946 RepID=UPI00381EF8B7
MATRASAWARTLLVCLLAGAAVSGSAGGGASAGERLSAQELLDAANETMGELRSATVVARSTGTQAGLATRVRTDFDDHCVRALTWEETGAVLEQIRIGETDYVRPNRAYLEDWSGKAMTGDPKLWSRTPASEARSSDGIIGCGWPFDSFGTAVRRGTTELDGTEAVELTVTAKAYPDDTYTFFVAAEGRPYILKVVYESAEMTTTTTFSEFDEPLDIRPPSPKRVLDGTRW